MSVYTDETLTAFLDGELPEQEMMEIATALEDDTALAKRVDNLHVDFATARDGFAALLMQAPSHGTAPPTPSNVVQFPARPVSRWIPLAAAAAIALVAGFGVGRTTAPDPPAAKSTWIATVANYVKLYDKNTLSGPTPSQQVAAAEVRNVSNALGKDLTLASLQTNGLTFRRAQTLTLNGKTLAQFMFVDESGTPIAICILKSKSTSKPMVSKQMSGLNAELFTMGGFAYLVIGNKNAEALQSVAKQLQAQI